MPVGEPRHIPFVQGIVWGLWGDGKRAQQNPDSGKACGTIDLVSSVNRWLKKRETEVNRTYENVSTSCNVYTLFAFLIQTNSKKHNTIGEI